MKKKILSILLLCTLVLSGCGFTESSKLMSTARKSIENGEYDKAMSNLSKVLDEDEANTEARGMYYQALKLQKATKCENRKDYEQAIIELQDLINDNSGSAKVKSQAEDMLEKVKEEYTRQKKAVITRKENAKKSAEENKNKYASGSTYGSNYNRYKKRTKKVEADTEDGTERESNRNPGSGINQGGTINNGSNNISRGNTSGAGATGQAVPGNTSGAAGGSISGGQTGN